MDAIITMQAAMIILKVELCSPLVWITKGVLMTHEAVWIRNDVIPANVVIAYGSTMNFSSVSDKVHACVIVNENVRNS